MHSPLPDSSALEAGIIEDSRPTRLSRVQDNVRNLLRSSFLAASPLQTQHHDDESDEIQPASPLHARQEEVLSSPSTTTSSSSSEDMNPGGLYPPARYQHHVQQMAHQSAMFNTRAVAALNHPDMRDPALAVFLQQKTEARQQRAWKRSKNRKLRHGGQRGCRWLVCSLAGLLLAAIVATYLALAMTSGQLSPTFHILFVLGILLATIVFAHSLVRTCMLRHTHPQSPRVYVVPHHGRVRHHHRHHHRNHQRTPTDFVPPTPIPVHVATDEVRPDSREAQPSAGAERASQVWDKQPDDLPHPPPAYGRWRGSVRADPELLHWQAVPSPDTPALPSPTYEEAMREQQATGPPSYVTRDSPARRRDVRNHLEGLAQAQVVEPEMVEGRGIGVAE